MAEDILRGKQRAFLLAYAETCSVKAAAMACDMARETHYVWLRTSPDYVREFAAIQQQAADSLEDEAVLRARAGSDVLLIFLLKGAKPGKFRERYEHSGPNGGPVQIQAQQLERLTEPELLQLRELAAKAQGQISDGKPGE